MSDDPTMKLPDTEQGYVTKPGVTAILERIAQLEARLSKQISDLTAEITGLRTETADNFSKPGKKIDILNR